MTRSPRTTRASRFVLLALPLVGDEQPDRMPDDLRRRVAEQPFRAVVPGGDSALQILAHDRIVGRLDERGEELGRHLAFARRALRLPFGRDVANDGDPAARHGTAVESRRVDCVDAAPARSRERDVFLVFDALAGQHPLDVRPNRLHGVPPDHVDDLAIDDLVEPAAHPLGVGAARPQVCELATAIRGGDAKRIDERRHQLDRSGRDHRTQLMQSSGRPAQVGAKVARIPREVT